MNIIRVQHIPDLLIVEPTIHEDERGYFYESYNHKVLSKFIGNVQFVQDNCSKSQQNVLRGLHYQTGNHAQAKLVRVTEGKVWDVAVDLRVNSPTYKQYYGIELSGENKKQFYIPRGFAHGFLVLSETAIFNYKCDNFYNKESEGGIIWNDEEINIKWPKNNNNYILSKKDQELPKLGDAKPI